MSATERVETPISMQELERRWAAVRKEMEARDIDALVMQNSSDWLGGYVKWFTDVPAHNDYPRNVIFHRDDLMTVVEMGARDGRDKLGRQGSAQSRRRRVRSTARRSSRSTTPTTTTPRWSRKSSSAAATRPSAGSGAAGCNTTSCAWSRSK